MEVPPTDFVWLSIKFEDKIDIGVKFQGLNVKVKTLRMKLKWGAKLN